MRKACIVTVCVLLGTIYMCLDTSLSPGINAMMKILPSVFLMVLLFIGRKRQPSRKEWLLPFFALFFSCLGDIAGEMPIGHMMLPVMMGFFAVAHFFYISAFLRHYDSTVGRPAKIAFTVFLCAYAASLIWLMAAHVTDKALLVGIIAYALIICFMSYTALMQERPGHWLFFIGAVLFMISDSVLVIHKFVAPVPARSFLVMSTYYAAQLLLNITPVSKTEASMQ